MNVYLPGTFEQQELDTPFTKVVGLQHALLKKHPEEIKISHRMGVREGTTWQNQLGLVLGLQLQQVGKSS